MKIETSKRAVIPSGRATRFFGAIALCAAPALAGDWYVDGVNGSDANGGTSPGNAWRTIGHALATPPAPPSGSTQVIHLAPGTYDTASGETFPILLRDAFQIVGDGGRDVTLVDAGGGSNWVMSVAAGHFGGNPTGPLTLVRGLSLVDGERGISIQSSSGTQFLTVEDCRISGMTSAGVHAASGFAFIAGITDVTLRRRHRVP